MTAPIVVIGHTDVGRRVCGLLAAHDTQVIHLADPSDGELRQVLEGEVSGVAIMLHDDIRALRYSLVVEHIRPGIRLFVAMFDRTTRRQLQQAVPNCTVLSPAAIAVPSMVAAAIAPQFKVVRRRERTYVKEWVSFTSHESEYEIQEFEVSTTTRLKGILGKLRGQFRPYDRGTKVLIAGALGLTLVTLLDTYFGIRHGEPLLRSLYDAVLTTATITTPDVGEDHFRQLWAASAATLVMIFLAIFGAGLVHHLLEGGHTSLVGRRVLPRSGHIVVAGMGQVGVRLAQELRDLGIPVVGIERLESNPNLSVAKALGIPVLIGNAASRTMLKRAAIKKAVAFVAAGSDERDNIAIAVDALDVAPDLNLVLRAGTDDAIDETRSLFHIGSAVDVNALTAAFVAHTMLVETPYAVAHRGTGIAAITREGEAADKYRIAVHCDC